MDCMELLKQIPDGSISLCLVDPPYGIDFQSAGGLIQHTGNQKLKMTKIRLLIGSRHYTQKKPWEDRPIK